MTQYRIELHIEPDGSSCWKASYNQPPGNIATWRPGEKAVCF